MKKIISYTVLMFAVCIGTAQAKPYLDIQEIKTEKGLVAWVVQDDTIPVIAVKFSFLGGTQLDKTGKEGTIELLSTLLDEGAGPRDSEAFQKDLDVHGIRIGFSAGLDRFSGSMKTPQVHKDLAFDMLSDALNRPHFKADAITRMKQALASQLRFLNQNPGWKTSRALFEAAFADTAYARPNEGTVDSLMAVTVDDVRGAQRALMCRERLTVAVVGQIDTKTLAADLDHVFGNLPKCETSVQTDVLPMQKLGETMRVVWQGAQHSVLMAQTGLSRQNKDWWAARILDFTLGSGQFSSRLMDEVRVKNSLTYGIYSSLVPYDRAPLWMVQANVDPSKTDDAIRMTRAIWDDVAQNGLTDNEIADAKAYLIGSLPLALTSTDRMASIVLQLQEDDLPADTLDRRADEINAVTVSDIRRVAREYLKSDTMLTIIVGPENPVSQKQNKE